MNRQAAKSECEMQIEKYTNWKQWVTVAIYDY